MAEQKKIADEHIEQVKRIQEGYATVTAKIGHIYFELFNLRRRIEMLEKAEELAKQEYLNLEQTEQTMIETINSTYGEGSLNLETGILTLEK